MLTMEAMTLTNRQKAEIIARELYSVSALNATNESDAYDYLEEILNKIESGVYKHEDDDDTT